MASAGNPTTLCTPVIDARLETRAAFDAWKGNTETTLNTLSSMPLPSTGQLTPEAEKQLLEVQKDISTTLTCLQTKLSDLNKVTNTISSGQESVLSLKDQIEKEKENVQIAKDRLAYVKYPESNFSFYESWYPMDKPLRPLSAVLLTGFGTLFLVLSVGYLLSFVGIDILIRLPVGGAGAPGFFAQLTPAFWGLLVVSTAIITYLLFR